MANYLSVIPKPERVSLVLVAVALSMVWIHAPVKAQENSMVTLESMLDKRPGWGNDVSEVAYVGTRCGALFTIVGGYFINNGTTVADKDDGKDYVERGKKFNSASVALSLMSQMTRDSFVQRGLQIGEMYGKTMQRNKALLNNALHTPVFEDLKFCNRYEHNFDKINEMIEEAKGKSTKETLIYSLTPLPFEGCRRDNSSSDV